MSSFRVTLLSQRATTGYALTTVIPGRNPSVCEFRSSALLHDGHSRVYRGILHMEDKSELKTICKIARAESDLNRLRREAEFYADSNHLLKLQGQYVPRFFGYYECLADLKEDGHQIRMGFMVLEDCGRRISFNELCDESLKPKIVVALLLIHQVAHLQHNDLLWNNFRHVLINDNQDIRIIDFDNAREHQCGLSMHVDLWAYEPPRADFGCGELFDVFHRLAIWTPVLLRCMGSFVSIFRVCTYKRLLKWLEHRHGETTKPDVLKYKAHEALKEYYDLYSYRFGVIGSPIQHRVPLDIPGVDEEEEEPVSAPRVPKWKRMYM